MGHRFFLFFAAVVVAVVAIAAVIQPPGHFTSATHSAAATGSRVAATAAIREQLASIAAQRAKTSNAVEGLIQERDQAARLVASLPSDTAMLRARIPLIKAELSALASEIKYTERDLAYHRERFREFRRKYEPEPAHLDQAERFIRGEALSKREINLWLNIPELKQGTLAYVQKRDRFAAGERMLVKELIAATTKRQQLTAELEESQRRVDAAPGMLAESKRIHEKAAGLIPDKKENLKRLTAEHDRLTIQLAEAEAREAKKRLDAEAERARQVAAANAARKAQEERKLRESQRSQLADNQTQVAAYPLFTRRNDSSETSRPLGHLPPAVRTLILAEMAGVDVGIDLIPDDNDYDGFVGSAPPVAIPRASVQLHRDGQGITRTVGNQTLVERANGSATLYTRNGAWEAVETNSGVNGMRFYDDDRGVTQFDYINPNTGIRTIGENPYEGNNYGQGWQQEFFLW